MKHKVYELGGCALDAAKRVYMARTVMAKFFEPQIVLPMNLADISRLSRKFYGEVHAEAKSEMPEFLERIGLMEPVTVVLHDAGQHPRAYHEFPGIYTNGGKDNPVYLYAPIGHDGKHFVPPDSRLLSAAEEDRVGNALFAGGWNDPISILPLPRQGTALPNDYTHTQIKLASPYGIYVPAGQSLQDMHAYTATKAAWEAHMSRLSDLMRDAILEAAQSIPTEQLDGDGVYVNSSYAISDGAPSIEMSLRRDGKGTNILSGGQVVPMPFSTDYLAKQAGYGECRILPHSNPTTQRGREIARLFATVPPFADTKNYASLKAPDGTGPYLHRFGGIDFLFYSSGADLKDFTPQGAYPISSQSYWWIRRDEEDANAGITPPPMPLAVIRELHSLRLTVPQASVAQGRLVAS